MNKLQYEIFKFKGIIKDIEPVELMNGVPPQRGVPTPNVWTAGENVHFDDEATYRVGGYAGFAEPMPVGAQPIFALNVVLPVNSYWIWIDGQNAFEPKVYVTDGVNHFDISPVVPLTGGAIGEWTGCILNGVPVLNNAVDYPFWWNGVTSAPVEVITGWPANQYCKAIRAYKYHLIALNLTREGVQVPEQYAWSEGADPGAIPAEWTPTPENDAGDNTLATSDGGILDGLTLRDDFIIYKAHSTFIMSYVAGQFVFNVRKLFNTSGIQTVNCVQELRGHHWVFADDDIIMHDGSTFKSIANNKVRTFMLNGVNPDAQILAQVVANTPTDEIWFNIPTVDKDKLALALVYSFTDEAWGTRVLPDVTYVTSGILPELTFDPTWDGALTQFDQDLRRWSDAAYSVTNDNLVMCAPVAGKLYNVDASVSNDGVDVEAWVERTDWTVGGQAAIWDNVLIRSIYPLVTGVDGDVIKVKIAGSSIVGEPIDWGVEQDYVIGSRLKVDSMTHGRFLNLRFSSTGGSPWAIHRIGIEYTTESKF